MQRRISDQIAVQGIIMAVTFLIIISACAMFQTTSTKPLTAKQQATIWMVVYNSIYDDTMAMAKNPAATPGQKDLVAKKKAILAQVWPPLKLYSSIAESGGMPSAQDAQLISDLINQLAALTAGRK
jgi:hypothetical protein